MSKPTSHSSPPGARERIVLTALKLFYQDGIRATGIDKIIAESGVAKMSFYRHFPSKNDLIAEFLRRRHEVWMQRFTEAVETKLAQGGGGLEIIADVLRHWFDDPDFRGCAFINTLAETPLPESQQHQIIRDHKASLESYITDLATRLGSPAPETTASAVMIIIEGTIIRAHMGADPTVCDTCKDLLKRISRSQRKPNESSVKRNEPPLLPGL